MMKFRSLKKEDEKQVISLLEQLGNDVNFKINLALSDPNCDCLVVENEKSLIGFGATVVLLVPSRGYIARIEDLIIDEIHRSQGLGRKLFRQLVGIGKSKDIKIFNVTSNENREIARKLYESEGFNKIDTDLFGLFL